MKYFMDSKGAIYRILDEKEAQDIPSPSWLSRYPDAFPVVCVDKGFPHNDHVSVGSKFFTNTLR